MSAIILDTETTGVDSPDVISLAHTDILKSPLDLDGNVSQRLFKPLKPISLGALATHHIIDEDLVDCEPWPGKWLPPKGVEYVIGHKVDYDWEACGSPHVARICTLALARHLLPDLDSHKLGALTYYFHGRIVARELLKNAHNAAADVHLCKLLLIELLKLMPGMSSWHQVWVASEKARIPTHLSFGKFGPDSDWAKANGQPRGMPIDRVRRHDYGYWSWLLSGKCDQVNKDPYLQRALRGEAA
ncbi:MAG TPA: 3'-5' exonuclease [Steroidobacteraceae bacterium]